MRPREERWQAKYDEVVAFIKENHRNSSKYADEERGFMNWCKHQRKIVNDGSMKVERVKKFEILQSLAEKFRHFNQY